MNFDLLYKVFYQTSSCYPQHDVHDKFLKEALDGVVEECVSFVGVDINVCSESLLR